MYLNQFSVRVIGGREVSGGYVELDHGKPYQLCLRNDRNEHADARVELDGKHVGIWRLDPHQSITLERPVHDQGRFTFYQVGTPEAGQAGLDAGDPNLGLLKVTFTPEMRPAVWPLTWTATVVLDSVPVQPTIVYAAGSDTTYRSNTATLLTNYCMAAEPVAAARAIGVSEQEHRAGGTGLSGHSDQEYGNAYSITYDYSQQTVIHLRLVAGHASDRPRPLTAYSTPVPPAVR